MNHTTAFAVASLDQVAEPRRVAQSLALSLGFSEPRVGKVAQVVTELATNLAKHARQGEILLRPLHGPDGAAHGLEVVAIDKGPGIPDVALSRRDGYSTSGTLGHGLGAIERQSDRFGWYTHRTGTAIAATLWRDTGGNGQDGPRLEIGAAHVSKAGEIVCGDAWSWRARPGRLSLFVADGLGHGLPAYEAANAAIAVFTRSHETGPARLIDDVHAALKPTRGAAVAGLASDLERGTVSYAGLGNISGTILLPTGARQNMVSHNGTAGHAAGRIQEFHYPLPPGAIIVVWSDGLQTQWDLNAYPGLRNQPPGLIAAVLYRDFSRRRDDTTVVVVKERARMA